MSSCSSKLRLFKLANSLDNFQWRCWISVLVLDSLDFGKEVEEYTYYFGF
ncbi:hypothetical protein RchiOBHm_Chr7g0197391 [Rosa chinensis]|uniref:Uncharacterized protein n=1 Tax=Rosa chinensis TaxID=74649 RepID=A0A2P6P6V3_ROSCH|nr:hypothetical protein RchiOBHm_Chr7g0197391 [Rosa chinensis]